MEKHQQNHLGVCTSITPPNQQKIRNSRPENLKFVKSEMERQPKLKDNLLHRSISAGTGKRPTLWDYNQMIVSTNRMLVKVCHRDGIYVPADVVPLAEVINRIAEDVLFENNNLESPTSPFNRKSRSANFDSAPPWLTKNDKSNCGSILMSTERKTFDKSSCESSFACGHNSKQVSKFREEIDSMQQLDDYVALRTFDSLTHVQRFLEVVLLSEKTVAFRINRVDGQRFTVLYQWFGQFNQQFMMLQIRDNTDYCLFLPPF